MKRISLIMVAVGLISILSSCNSSNNLPKIDYHESGNLSYNGKSYMFLGSSADLKKKKKIAYTEDDEGIITQVWEINNYPTEQWLMTIRKTLMGDWVLYGEENVASIPAKFAKGNIIEYEQKFKLKDKTFQLFSKASSDLEIQSQLGDIIIEQENYAIFSIKGYNQEQWLILTSNQEESYLYKEINVEELPIELYQYAWSQEIIEIQE